MANIRFDDPEDLADPSRIFISYERSGTTKKLTNLKMHKLSYTWAQKRTYQCQKYKKDLEDCMSGIARKEKLLIKKTLGLCIN